MIELLQEKGNQLREPYSKHLDDGIFELRCKVGSNITRVLYFFYYKGQIILTNGFVKKTHIKYQVLMYKKSYIKMYNYSDDFM